MNTRIALSVAPLLLAACRPSTEASWALDPIWIEPAPAGDPDGVHGFETWQVYSEKWREHPNDRYYLCAVVVEIAGTPSDAPCDGCVASWDLTSAVVESDCDASVEADPTFLSLQAVGLTDVVDGAGQEHPGQTSEGWADYGDGWERHGDAWPATLDAGAAASSDGWDGVEPFTLWPDAIWPVGGGATATSVSRQAGR